VYNPTDLLYTQRYANATNILYTQHFLLKIRNSKISAFCYAHKRPSPFFLYIPTKTLFLTIKYELTIERVKSQKKGKRAHPQTPLSRFRKNFSYYCDALREKFTTQFSLTY